MPKKKPAPELTGSQVKQIRANLARSASMLGNRLVDCAMDRVKMNQTQVSAAKTVLGHCLPAMQQVEDTTPERTDPHEIKEQIETMLIDKITSMDPDQLQALLDKRGSLQ